MEKPQASPKPLWPKRSSHTLLLGFPLSKAPNFTLDTSAMGASLYVTADLEKGEWGHPHFSCVSSLRLLP